MIQEELIANILSYVHLETIFIKVTWLNKHFNQIIRVNNSFWIKYSKYLNQEISKTRYKYKNAPDINLKVKEKI